MIVTTKEIADIFSMTDRGVRLWAEKGCPRAGYGKWEVKAVLFWWLDNMYQAGDDDESLAAAKLEYWQAKARTEAVKADIAEEKVISVEDFKMAWAWRISEMASMLSALPLRVAPIMAQKEETVIRGLMRDEVWKIRDMFSRTGKFFPDSKPKKTKPRKKNNGSH
ncbi:MAG: hypothetical protein DRH26_06715 [Deltaproteobacteria bacterium]|nr:MAG: hypothetical protein DRH26_06715 [Deltaproteobacteria bacterium]